MAGGERLTTEISGPVAKRLKVQHAVTGVAIKRLVDAALDRYLLSMKGLKSGLRESEATS